MEQTTREECFHFVEQTKWGLGWYLEYGNEFINLSVLFTDAYDALSAEIRAKNYAGRPNEVPISRWTIGFSFDWLPY